MQLGHPFFGLHVFSFAGRSEDDQLPVCGELVDEANVGLCHIAERVEPWTYLKFPYLKKVGWKGFVDGPDSGVYAATPLSRLNAADGMATPLAQEEYEKMYETLGGKPVLFSSWSVSHGCGISPDHVPGHI